ncbi:MAG: hypothetical protein Kow00108_10080 [Calditrichia bacterium]
MIGVTYWENDSSLLESFVADMVKFGIHFVEIRLELPDFHVSSFKLRHLKTLMNIKQTYGVEFSFHASIMDTNVASPNDRVREASFLTISKEIKNLSALGPVNLVVHAGKLVKQAQMLAGDSEKLLSLKEKIIQRFVQLGDEAEENQITLLIENSPPNSKKLPLIKSAEEHRNFLEQCNHPAIQAIVDVGHAMVAHGDIWKHLDCMKPWLKEIHLHNNNGIKDEHLGINRGKIDFMEIIAEFNGAIPIVLEIKDKNELFETLDAIKLQNVM